MENRSENKIIITVSGVDRIGIVAKSRRRAQNGNLDTKKTNF